MSNVRCRFRSQTKANLRLTTETSESESSSGLIYLIRMSLVPRPAPEQFQQLYSHFWDRPRPIEEIRADTQTFGFLDVSAVDSYPAFCGLEDAFLFWDEYDKFTTTLQNKLDQYKPVPPRFVLLGQPGIGDYSYRMTCFFSLGSLEVVGKTLALYAILVTRLQSRQPTAWQWNDDEIVLFEKGGCFTLSASSTPPSRLPQEIVVSWTLMSEWNNNANRSSDAPTPW